MRLSDRRVGGPTRSPLGRAWPGRSPAQGRIRLARTDLLIAFHSCSRALRSRASVREATHTASRCSLRQRASRSSGSSPLSTAASTAHPGSPSWAQSPNRHWVASSSTSGKTAASPPVSRSPTPRSPGVSMTAPAAGARVQLAGDRGVPALADGSQRVRRHQLGPDQGVEQRGLARSGAADEGQGASVGAAARPAEPALLRSRPTRRAP